MTHRPAGPPQKIQEYMRLHQTAVAQGSARDAASAAMTWALRIDMTGRMARGTVTDVKASKAKNVFTRPVVTQFPS